jgi:UDP-N-acetylmuramoylalanine--D-glutamate ligase
MGAAVQMRTGSGDMKKALVVGLGKTGLACVRYLAARGVEVAATDSRERPPGLDALTAELPDVAVFLGGFDEQVFALAEDLVISPGVSLKEPVIARAMARGARALGDIELFARAAAAPVIAITGSNGKSTVTSMVGAMAREDGREVRVGGNLGTPALELLGDHEPDCYVLELSSFQLETVHSLNARAATVLNVSPDHMDRYDTVDAYAGAKQRIFRGDGVMVLNSDDPVVMAMAQPGRRCVRFGLAQPGEGDFGLREHDGALWLVKGERRLLHADRLRLPGRHNLANVLAALALGEAAGFGWEPMLRSARRFPGLAHRTQWVAERDGVVWYNDSKGTNVGATLAAVQGMPGPVVLIAGGLAKGADFSSLRPVLATKARAVVLIGRDAPLLARALAGAVKTVAAADMDEAVARARELARPGDSVLLSPACASFDMFSGYEERGERFMDAVKRLPA